MTTSVDFSPYLQSLVESYMSQPNLYTLTDLQVEIAREERSQLEPTAQKRVERLEVLAGLRKYVQQGHILLVGKPGSGKSTALQRLRWELAQRALADQSQPIPVLVQLKGLRNNYGILDAIAFELQKGDPNIQAKDIRQLLLKGQLFLLFDGVNEVPCDNLQSDVQLFHNSYAKVPMIFTSRELGMGLNIEKKLEMCALTDPQIRDFVGKYLPDYGDVLLRQLKDRLHDLAETPLLLKLLCEVFDPVTQQIPQSKGELFRAVAQKYNTWKTREGVRTSEKFWQWNGELLCYLAFRMLQADGSPTAKWLEFNRADAERLLESFLTGRVKNPGERAKDWLQDLLEHHLLQVAANPKQIEFRHQLFQEYYAAEYLLAESPHMSDTQLKRDYLNLLKWTEPLAVMLSLVTDEVLAMRVVKLAIKVDWMLGSRLAGEVKRELQKKAISILQHQINAPDWLWVRLLAKTKSDVVIPYLLEALNDKDPDVRGEVVRELGKFNSEQFTEHLLNALSDSNSWVRRMAVLAFKQSTSEQVLEGLLRKLDDEDFKVRLEAAEILAKRGSEPALNTLFALLRDSSNLTMQMWVCDALGEIGTDIIRSIIGSQTEQMAVELNRLKSEHQLNSDKVFEWLLDVLNPIHFETWSFSGEKTTVLKLDEV